MLQIVGLCSSANFTAFSPGHHMAISFGFAFVEALSRWLLDFEDPLSRRSGHFGKFHGLSHRWRLGMQLHIYSFGLFGETRLCFHFRSHTLPLIIQHNLLYILTFPHLKFLNTLTLGLRCKLRLVVISVGVWHGAVTVGRRKMQELRLFPPFISHRGARFWKTDFYGHRMVHSDFLSLYFTASLEITHADYMLPSQGTFEFHRGWLVGSWGLGLYWLGRLLGESLAVVSYGWRDRRWPELSVMIWCIRIVHRYEIFRHELLHIFNNMVVFEKVVLALTLVHELLHDLSVLFLLLCQLMPIIRTTVIQLFSYARPRFYGHRHHFKRNISINAPHDITHHLFLSLFLLVGFLQLVNRVQNELVLVLLTHGLENFNCRHCVIVDSHDIEIL